MLQLQFPLCAPDVEGSGSEAAGTRESGVPKNEREETRQTDHVQGSRDEHRDGSEASCASDEAAAGSEAEDRTELETLKEQLAETHDRMLRIAAEYDNARKRWEKEKADLRQYSISEFSRDLLPVIDAFDKAMSSIENSDFDKDTEQGQSFAAIVEGVQLVSKVLNDAITKHGIEKIPGKGEAFNPEFHNAIARDVDPSVEREMVSEEFVTGYKIGARVLRTAMVKVVTPD